ncbi:MAG TPA: hypothetical protein VFO41_08375 [Alphaproteobacteria bacterium]|nr:hypothetical protein [Alphaproteobacteria bacterium]
MSRLTAELERLERALDRVESALTDREARMTEELEALRRTAKTGISAADADAVRAVASRVDQAIERLESVLGS